MQAIAAYIETHKERFLTELFELIRIPSVSQQSAHRPDMARAAVFLRQRLLDAGADLAEVVATAGHPVVYAEKLIDPARPTVLVYGHYDVQPAEPLELWKSPPFEPELRDGDIYGRGSSDNKGQLYMHVKALEAMVRTGQLPVNIKFMLEGEEEMGSPSLADFCRRHRQRLACDVILVSDTSMLGLAQPAITTGLRGLTYLEVEVNGPDRDLHSGLYGGAVANPVNELARLLAGLVDEAGRITIPGFYDRVRQLSRDERDELARAPFDLSGFRQAIGIARETGEAGYSVPERLGIRPCLDINGIWGGYTGEGAKTVLPARACAKVSMRLVPDQDPDEIADLFEKHLKALAPPSVQVAVRRFHGGLPYVTRTDAPAYRAARRALAEGFGREPVELRSGGSIPIIPLFEQVLGVQSILMGFGLDTDAIHSPNERFALASFYRGIETIPLFHRYLGEG